MKQLQLIYPLAAFMLDPTIVCNQEEKVTITTDNFTSKVYMLTGQGSDIRLMQMQLYG